MRFFQTSPHTMPGGMQFEFKVFDWCFCQATFATAGNLNEGIIEL
jgi:hypothetical protein